MPKDIFKLEDLIKLWNIYADNMKKQGNPLLHSVMTTKEPTVEGDYIVCEVPNQAVGVKLEQESVKLLGYIRGKLNNYHLKLSTPIIKEENVKMIFTSHEKFKFMNDKNPLLNKLKSTLNLDLV